MIEDTEWTKSVHGDHLESRVEHIPCKLDVRNIKSFRITNATFDLSFETIVEIKYGGGGQKF